MVPFLLWGGTMSNSYDFDEQLAMGKRWESELSDRLESVLTHKTIRNILFEEQPEMQRAGIDAVIETKTPDIDTKVQRTEHLQTGNLPIETWSVYEETIPGWFYTGESDVIVWAYENQAGNNLHPTGYLMLKDEWLVDWFNGRIDEFREVEIPNDGWTTVCRLVPIDEFPDHHLIEFNPTLEKNRKTDQYELVEWSK